MILQPGPGGAPGRVSAGAPVDQAGTRVQVHLCAVANKPKLCYTGLMDIQTLKRELSAIVTGFEGVCLVYLFGSQVGGVRGPMSDHDFAVLVERGIDGLDVQARLAHELARVLGTERVDVVLLNRAPAELAYAVIAQGKVVYERDTATRVEYEATVLSLYSDFLPYLRAQRQDILRGEDDAQRVRRYRAALGRTERTLGQIAATGRKATDRV